MSTDPTTAIIEYAVPFMDHIKQHDNDHYICTLFASEKDRQGLFVLYAFHYEISRIQRTVSEPMIGLIKLAWWREAIDELYNGQVRRHEILEELHKLLQYRPLSKHLFEAIIDGYDNNLEGTPPATLEALEAYGEAISSSLYQLALEVLGITDHRAHKAAYHIGVAWMLIGYMRSIRAYSASKRVLFPQEMMQQAGMTTNEILAGRSLKKARPMVRKLVERARLHLREARKLRRSIPVEALPALLPAAITDVFIRRIRRTKYSPFRYNLERNRLLIQLKIMFKVWRGRF